VKLAVGAIVALTATADARGINFNIYGTGSDPRIVAETARITRCPRDIEEDTSKHGKLVTCRQVSNNYLAGRQSGSGVDLEMLTAERKVVWSRHVYGTVAFATDNLLVFEAGKGYRAIWLAEADGKTVADVTFAPIAAEKLPDWCGDQIDGYYKSKEKTPRLAAVCLILD